jgi:hypothetical protein
VPLSPEARAAIHYRPLDPGPEADDPLVVNEKRLNGDIASCFSTAPDAKDKKVETVARVAPCRAGRNDCPRALTGPRYG